MATSLSQENINFLRLAGLLLRVAPRAVRRKFDYEFNPEQLQQFMSKNRGKIYDLTYKNRVITLVQYDLLFPKGSSKVSSDMFDVSLMTCLLRHFTELDIHDTLPLETFHTDAADISRIKFYRNSIVHSDNGKVNENNFSEIWKCVAEAIIRLAPELKPEIDALRISSLNNVTDIIDFIRIEKQLEITNQHTVTINKKLETLEIEKNNITEIQLRTLKEWRNTDKKYIPTSATTFILRSVKHNRGVIITGSPGCGKSAAAQHVAFELEKEGYEIHPCNDPSEIVKHLNREKFQVFVIDDAFGKFSLNQQKADSWEQNDGKLNMLIESSNQNDDDEDNFSKPEAKFIFTCRENIYVHKAFPKLICFSLVQCSFSSKYKIDPEEMRNIALSYLPENTVNDIQNICLYDFFPLICSLYSKSLNQDPSFFTHPVKIIGCEISEMKKKSEASFLCISLLVLRNNKFRKDELRNKDVQQLVEYICWDSKIESVSIVAILNSFERLKGVYFTESDDIYKAIHDKMFDIIAAAIAPYIMKCLIEHVDIAFLANRTHLSSLSQNSVPFDIYIPQEFESLYLKRQCQEAMKGKYWEVFGSIQTEQEAYRKLLLSVLKQQDTCQQISYNSIKDGMTPLYVSSHLGYLDFVEYFVVKCPNHTQVKDKEGRSPFYVACEKGRIAVVRYLMKYNEDINAENLDKTTALSATCLNGHTILAQLLLDNKADMNITNKLNQNSLHFACLKGNVKLVNVLLFGDYNVDINNVDTFGHTALHAACQNGHTETVKTLIEFGMDVNQKNENCRTPLYLACEHGYYDTVKLITEYMCSKQISSTKPIADELNHLHSTNSGITVLHVACKKGQTEVVKLLLDVGMKINDTSIHGSSPLILACKGGHYDTVKFLLDLNNQTLDSRVDTYKRDINGWSALHAACYKGHTEVVKLLIDVCMNLDETSYTGSTPLFLACQRGNFETVKYLLDLNGKNINSRVDTRKKRVNGLSALHTACINGHLDIVKLLVNVGVNLNDTSNKGCTPLFQACEEGHYEIVKFLLDLNGQALNSRVNTTLTDSTEWSVLDVACYNGHIEVVKLLVDVCINLNRTTDYGSTPLNKACQKGHYDTVKFLLDLNGQVLNSRVDTTIKSLFGGSALHVACKNGHIEVVKLLVDVGMNLNDTSNSGSTPLHKACEDGHCDTVKWLLDLNGQALNSRVDTTIKDIIGWSALHVACYNGHEKVVKLLIDVGMYPNDTANSGATPLHKACQKGHYDTAKYLLDLNGQTVNSRVDTTIKDKDGWSALHVACQKGHIEVVKLLINVGLNINDTTNSGSTPLYLACQEGQFETVKYLMFLNGPILNSRVDTTIKCDNGFSALEIACINGNLQIVKVLFDVGMNPNDKSNAGTTPFYQACRNGHYEIVKYFLNLNRKLSNSRVDTTIKDKDGWSALHVACFNGHAEIIKLLVAVGMNVNKRDHSGKSAIYLAYMNGHDDIVKILKDTCAE
ncbi:serine/threonine-protein phosphatase 6 regulatory ankyrin repeat subunit A [Mytilus galloprovincialis]|uniref:Serine/threonine-protein phosphatase 6 regulatory ankyrin repeat subunit A n=1 Tax=Mytilus galloprovincialis TaxID=29158 RepID=A0A8B6F1W7_MYTGA|nr:serine/threonine-protein phosphatase 6 regulatory ankyrin repeat subunit A [Mytilus galloprovincialis]